MTGDDLEFRLGTLDEPAVGELLAHHVESAKSETEPGSDHALDLDGLRNPDIRFWSVWKGDELLGTGAWWLFEPGHGELKSMHVVQAARGQGIGGAMLQHLVDDATDAGITRLSLETGAWDYFAPAVALYRSRGFSECPPFGDYVPDRNSIFMTRTLAPGDTAR
ncbi:MAG: GNAT family N-acetyltransferase [Pseudolysinimonas sp.]